MAFRRKCPFPQLHTSQLRYVAPSTVLLHPSRFIRLHACPNSSALPFNLLVLSNLLMNPSGWTSMTGKHAVKVAILRLQFSTFLVHERGRVASALRKSLAYIC